MTQAQIADKRGVAFVESCFIVRTRAWLYMMLSVNEQQKLQRKHIQSVKTKRSALTQTLLSGYSYGSDWRALLLGSLSMLSEYKGAASASTSYRNARWTECSESLLHLSCGFLSVCYQRKGASPHGHIQLLPVCLLIQGVTLIKYSDLIVITWRNYHDLGCRLLLWLMVSAIKIKHQGSIWLYWLCYSRWDSSYSEIVRLQRSLGFSDPKFWWGVLDFDMIWIPSTKCTCSSQLL